MFKVKTFKLWSYPDLFLIEQIRISRSSVAWNELQSNAIRVRRETLSQIWVVHLMAKSAYELDERRQETNLCLTLV